MTISKIKVGNTTHDLHDTRIPGIDSTPTSDSTNVITSGGVYSAIDDAIEDISQDVSDKADKVSGATNGNFAALDSNGNLTDSEHKHGDYVTALGTSGNYVTWTKNGAATNLTVPFATTSSKVGTSTVGASNKPIYLNAGTPTAVESVGEGFLSWGGQSVSGSVTPIGMSVSLEHSANRVAFINGDLVAIEYSSDGGTTWTDYGYSKGVKSALFTTSASIPIGRPNASTEVVAEQSKSRITLTAQNGNNPAGRVYTNPKKLLVNISSATALSLLIERRTGANYNTNGSWETFGTYTVSGWSGWNDIPLIFGTLGGGNTQTGNNWQLRLTFTVVTVSTNYPKTASVLGIRIFGDAAWATPSNMATTNHLYSFDTDQNAFFPANIYPSVSGKNLGSSTYRWYVYGTGGNFSSSITANGFIKSSGTSSQFLKADGSVDSTSYEATSNKTTSLSSSSTDTQYPSAKVVFDSLRRSTPEDAVSAEFFTRTVTEDAIANIQKIYGNIVKWNQLVQSCSNKSEVYGITRTRVNNYTVHYEGTSTYSTGFTGTDTNINVINGHKYYAAASGAPSNTVLRGGTGLPITQDALKVIVTSNTTSAQSSLAIFIPSGTTINTNVSFVCVDLTLMFGAGHEPSTVEEFEALYPLPYYAYNSGQIVSNKATALETVGFNQWDEEWEVGSYNVSTGAKSVRTDAIRSKNFTPVLPGETYYLWCGSHRTAGDGVILWYDDQKNFIKNSLSVVRNTFVAPAQARYLTFYIAPETTYKNDICINISDLSRNGTYEPYNSHQIDLNIPTLTGKLNGAGSSVVIFPDGMMAGTEKRDELSSTKGNKRFKMVDAGSVEWSYQSNNNRFYTTSAISGALADGDCVLAGYTTEKSYDDMTVFLGGNRRVYLYNASMGSDTTALANSLSGKNLIYEIPEEEYILDNALQFQYPVTAGGTETVLATTETAPMKMDVIYGNAADATSNLSPNFISVDSMKAFLNTLGTQMGGTWNMQYNNGKFEFTFSSS